MKLPLHDTKNKVKTSANVMSRMTALLSEKDDIIEQKTDIDA
jgi:transposase